MNNVLQALIHIFKNVGTRHSTKLDQKTLVAELNQFGVSLADLETTLTKMALWMASQPTSVLPALPSNALSLASYAVQPHKGNRVFSLAECIKISQKSRGFLINLEQAGVLSSQMRECVIDQLMQATEEVVRLSLTKWIAFQTLFHDAPPQHVAYLEWLLFAKVMEAH